MPTLIRCMIEEARRRDAEGAPEAELRHWIKRITIEMERNEA